MPNPTTNPLFQPFRRAGKPALSLAIITRSNAPPFSRRGLSLAARHLPLKNQSRKTSRAGSGRPPRRERFATQNCNGMPRFFPVKIRADLRWDCPGNPVLSRCRQCLRCLDSARRPTSEQVCFAPLQVCSRPCRFALEQNKFVNELAGLFLPGTNVRWQKQVCFEAKQVCFLPKQTCFDENTVVPDKSRFVLILCRFAFIQNKRAWARTRLFRSFAGFFEAKQVCFLLKQPCFRQHTLVPGGCFPSVAGRKESSRKSNLEMLSTKTVGTRSTVSCD